MLVRLIYFSEIGELDSISDIKNILKTAQKNNAEQGITGALYFDEKFFVQILEGDRNNVSHTYTKIANDKRHKNAVLVDVSPIAKRDFANWSVLYLGNLKPAKEFLFSFSPFSEFNPHSMTTENLIELVLALKARIKTT